MWFLEHEGLFGGKRVWLRPGSQQLFGRTKQSDGDKSEGKKVFIDNKNVSRKHMMIRVLDAPAENGAKLHTRSQVEITDLSCRQGTVIDEGQTLKSTKAADGTITYDKTTLSGTAHNIKLSNSYPPFKLTWKDVVFTFASKDKKDEKAKTRNAQLYAIDIKTSSEFVVGKTTHVVSQRRNLPKVLQALVSGTPIVTPDYLDAILKQATHSVDENYVPSGLEEDFDTWWPNEKEYIPPTGAEPVARPDQELQPDPSRSEVFSGLTFIFLNESQYSNLHPVISGGGGKALLFPIRHGETTVAEYVEYVQNAAGHKKRSKVNAQGLPVVTIRLSNYPDGLEDWAASFVEGVDQALNQRSILQNEFLDAIVTKDTSSLRRPPTEVMEVDSSIPPASRAQQSMRESASASQSKDPSQPAETSSAPVGESTKTNTRKRTIRRGVTSRFTGFDDYEPPSKVRKVEDAPMEDVHQSIPVQDSPPDSPQATQTRRAAQSQVNQSVERAEQMNQLFPAAAAIKRQRAATRGPSASMEPEQQSSTQKPMTMAARIEVLQKTKQEADKEINVREQTRKRVAEQEEKRKAEEESLREALEGVDISEIRANIQVEEMQLRTREQRAREASQVQSERWNPDWNGRKNFKKFRRKGAEQGPQSQKVLVQFEEAPKRKGFGDTFVLEDLAPPVRTQKDEQRLKRRIGPQSESEAEAGFSRRKRTRPAPEVVNVLDSGPNDEEMPEENGRTQRSSGRTQRVAETQLEDEQTQRGSKKRGPTSVAAGPSKRRNARRNDDSDEEETGFRFRRRA